MVALCTCLAPGFDENATCTVQSTDADSATVSWPAPSAARFYYIDIGSDKLINTTLNFHTVTDLSPITNYMFTVTVYGNADTTGNSIECRAKTGLYIFLRPWHWCEVVRSVGLCL